MARKPSTTGRPVRRPPLKKVEPAVDPLAAAATDAVTPPLQVTAETPLADGGATTPVVTNEPTTVDPNGAEGVVEIDGDAIRPTTDGTNPLEQSTGAPDILDPNGPGAVPPVTEQNIAEAELAAALADAQAADAAMNEKAEDDDIEGSPYRQHYKKLLKESGVVPPEGRLLYPNEPLTFQGNVIKRDHVILTEDVYRMVLPFRSRRPTFTLVARAGKRVNRARVVTKAEYLEAVGDLFDQFGV